jgi:hypothetical protein
VKCFQGPSVDAVGLCPQCGKGLCHPCASRFSSMVCESCCLTANRSKAREIYVRLTVTVLLLLGTAIFMGTQHVPRTYGPISGAILVCLYWGAKYMGARSVEDRVRATLHPIAGLVEMLVRMAMAGIIGVFAAPLGIASSIIELSRVRRTVREICTSGQPTPVL